MTKAEKDTKTHQVLEILDTLRPAMEADGGGVDLIAIEEEGIVIIRLKGMCLACPSASLTLKLGIEKTLKEKLDWVQKVVRVQ